MKNVGIVCEYNPFHNGHEKQLRHVGAFGASICLMSGNYVQRGEPAIVDKYIRARAAVECGANLVLELPLTYAIASAEGFADGAVEIFTRLGCVDALCFGSESGDLQELMQTAERLLAPEFSELLKAELDKGVSFPKARQLALGSTCLEQPNDILGVEYCKAILKRGHAIEPMTLRREGDYHTGEECENPSASYLRTQEDWSDFMLPAAWELFREAPRYTIAAGERAWLARLRAMSEAEFETLPYGSEGLWRKLMQACRCERSLEDILAATKSKRYPRTRLMRMLLCAYLGITEQMMQQPVPYVRVLATDEIGQTLLRRMRKSASIDLLHAGETAPRCEYAEWERRAEDLYGLFCANDLQTAGALRDARLFRKNLEKNEKNTCILL